jgi:FeS assembly SUF system regulator
MVSEGNTCWSASELCEKSGVPLPTVSKVLKQLSKGGVITAQRGASGGYTLAQSANKISIAAIIEAMDGPIALTDCAEGGDQDCRIQHVCPMSGNWNKINSAVKAALETVSLADMATPAPYFFRNVKTGTGS